jgi:hypothetical protein
LAANGRFWRKADLRISAAPSVCWNQEVVDLEGLRQIVDRAGPHEPYGLVDVAVACDEKKRG